MAQFLHIRVDDIDLLLPAFQVHEVMDLDPQNKPHDGQTLWRNQVIPQFDMGLLLDRVSTSRARNYGVVYDRDPLGEQTVMLRIDRVLGLRTPKPEHLHKLPATTTLAHRVFDAVWTDPQPSSQQGQKAYCLKAQLPADFMG